MMRNSITYVLPGIEITYRGPPRSYIAWVRDTAIGFRGLAGMWISTVWWLIKIGMVPTPRAIGRVMVEMIRRSVGSGAHYPIVLADAPTPRPGQGQDGADGSGAGDVA